MKFQTQREAVIYGFVLRDYQSLFGTTVLKERPTPLLKFHPYGEERALTEVSVCDLTDDEAKQLGARVGRKVRVTTTYELIEDAPAAAEVSS